MSDTETMPFVRPDVAALLAMLAQMGGTPMEESTVEEARQLYLAMTPMIDAPAVPLAVIRDLTCPGPAGDIKLRLYDAQQNRGSGPAMVFFHGGGFVIGDLDTHHNFCTTIAKQLDIPVIAVDYRLAPEHPFPAAPIDCEAAARWIADNGKELGLEITGLLLCGDSAGGNLTIVATHALMAAPAAVPLIAQFPIYPVTNSSATGGSMAAFSEGYLLTSLGMAWFNSHYRQVAGDPRHDVHDLDHSGTPPTLVFTASLDPLSDQGRAYAASLQQANVRVIHDEAEGNVHGFICLRGGIPSAADDVDRMIGHMKILIKEAMEV
jgi:acetyl esterase